MWVETVCRFSFVNNYLYFIGNQDDLIDPKIVILGEAQSGKSSLGNILYLCDKYAMDHEKCDFSTCPVIH